MGIFIIILGVLLMVGGFSCLFTPFASVLAAGYLIGIMLFIYGIFSLVRAIQRRANFLVYIPAILAIVVGFISVFHPGGSLVIDAVILTLLAIWFLVQGVVSLIMSIRFRKELPNWGLGVVSGIFGIVAGIISLIYPHAEMFAVGILIAVFLIETGLGLITTGTVLTSQGE